MDYDCTAKRVQYTFITIDTKISTVKCLAVSIITKNQHCAVDGRVWKGDETSTKI